MVVAHRIGLEIRPFLLASFRYTVPGHVWKIVGKRLWNRQLQRL